MDCARGDLTPPAHGDGLTPSVPLSHERRAPSPSADPRVGAERGERRPKPETQNPTPTAEVWLLDLGRVEYGATYQLQRRLAEERDAGRIPDLLLLLEHDPVFTLGRRGSHDDIFASDAELAARGIAVFETNRGGLVTYHGPGQVVGYPITKLRALAGDAPTYVWRLEETIVRTLANLGIVARRDAGNRGVFAGDGERGGKIAAIGVAVTHGVTMHGFALNVHPDLEHFSLIDACGIGDLGVTSVERLQGSTPTLDSVRERLASHFSEVFARNVRPAPAELWHLIGSWGLFERDPRREFRPVHS